MLELDLTPILETGQSSPHWKMGMGGGLPESPEYPKESSTPSFDVWEEENWGEVLDREPGTAICLGLRGHFLG